MRAASSFRAILLAALLVALPACAQQNDPHTSTVDAAAASSAGKTPRRTRLYLKDGSYQIVMSYKIAGAKVTYISAERGGDAEDIPLALVDLDKTQAWEKQHAPVDPDAPRPAPAIDPELLKEEAERALFSPAVAQDLRLNPEYTLLMLDTWHAMPELVPLTQSDGQLNRQTSHNILRGGVNPLSHPHQVVTLRGERSLIQVHVNEPVFFLHLDDEVGPSGPALTVDTHGASQSVPKHKADDPTYVIVRTDVRQDARVIASFNIYDLGSGHRQEDLIETTETPLPGGHWLKIVPNEKLLIGEYALLEVLGAKEINLGVWDFGVHPTAPENRDALKPEPPRPIGLGRHPQP
jgi:hypothetical protein